MQNIHFIGIGGIGMSALASIMMAGGNKISGSELHKNDLTEKLEAEGVTIANQHSVDNIADDCDMVVFTQAIPEDNVEKIAAKERGIKMASYAEALGEIANQKKLVLIVGTHGKTTVTGMLSRIAIDADLDPTIVIGSKMRELDGRNYKVGDSDLFIAEGCEYKRSFLSFKPDILIITNVEPDHLDYFKTDENYYAAFKELIQNMPEDGIIIANKDDHGTQIVLEGAKQELRTFGLADLFSFYSETRLELQVPGNHNRLNALDAFKAAEVLGVEMEDAKTSLANFTGTWRRLELVGNIDDTKIYDDYAHHPTEIMATLQALREIYPSKKICAVFQPHQFSRTHHFLKEFGYSFKEADTVIIPNIYKVRDTEEDIQKVSAKDLIKAISEHNDDVQDGENLEQTAEIIKTNINKWDVVVLMGAGNVTEIKGMIL